MWRYQTSPLSVVSFGNCSFAKLSLSLSMTQGSGLRRVPSTGFQWDLHEKRLCSPPPCTFISALTQSFSYSFAILRIALLFLFFEERLSSLTAAKVYIVCH